MMKSLFVIIYLIPTISFAQAYDVQSTGEYVMGDSDTKVEARRIALDHAKRLAVEKIGTYIETKTEVANWQLTRDEITTYTAAIVKTSLISENVRLLEDKTTVITISINASVDIGALDIKIREIRDDSKRKDQIEALQAENIKLTKDLEFISTLLKQSKASEANSLRKQREEIFTKIDKNQNSITVAFEKGALLNLAQINKDEFENEKKLINDCMQYVVDNIVVKLGKPKVIDYGDTAELEFEIKWNYKPANNNAAMSMCFKKSDEKTYLYYDNNLGCVMILPHGSNSKKLYDYINKTFGKGGRVKHYIEVTVGNTVKQIFLYESKGKGMKVAGRNNMLFSDIPKKQLADISSIDAKLITSE